MLTRLLRFSTQEEHVLAFGTGIFDADGLNIGLFIVRVTLAVTMIAHGYNHIWGGGKIAGTAGWFASLGLKPGITHAWFASITELVCGASLIVGLLNPFAAGGVVGVMVVAWIINHRGNGFFIFRPGEGWEYVMNLALVGLALGAMGPGEWSLDSALGIELVGPVGFGITAAIGIGGALALLAAFWRPAPEEPAKEG
jgi:putative oxidoreductase